MTKTDKKIIIKSNKEKLIKSIELLKASLSKVETFDEKRNYTADELEPYDALCDRFVRTVEVAIKFFRSYQLYFEVLPTETFRDLILYSEKQRLIKNIEKWYEMRDVRNRIVHDYLPEQQKELFDDITGPFASEILFLYSTIQALNIE